MLLGDKKSPDGYWVAIRTFAYKQLTPLYSRDKLIFFFLRFYAGI